MTSPSSLIDVSRECFMHVGPARIAICALHAISDADLTDSVIKRRVKANVDRVRSAVHMLEVTFPSELAERSHKISDELEGARRNAIACLKPISDALHGTPDDFYVSMGGRVAFLDHYFDVVERDINDFLLTMHAELTAAHEARLAAHQAAAMESIAKANTVGRTISSLAVNAAIESSRSGDRGFRVIADEIKSLSGRTQTLLKEVSEVMMRRP